MTPYFVRWSLALECPLRRGTAWHDPEATQRHLRALREASEAQAAGRWQGDFCFREMAFPESPVSRPPVVALRLASVLAPFGDGAQVNATCAQCRAHVNRFHPQANCAGCFGTLELGHESESLAQRLMPVCDYVERLRGWPQACSTTPAWYGLWIASPLPEAVLRAWEFALASDLGLATGEAAAFRAAVLCSLEGQLPLNVRLFARGNETSQGWILEPHCRRCQAPWPASGNCCAACGSTAGQGRTRRHGRGERPWLPLDELAGAPEAYESWIAARTVENKWPAG